MKISIGSDHGAYELKEKIVAWLGEHGYEVQDFGCHSTESCDYPDFCGAAAKAVANGEADRAIVVCTTGIGASISANKVRGVRCALCADLWTAEMTRRHNDTNALAIGAGVVGPNLALRIVETWLTTEFEGGRHQRRIDKMMALENE